MPYIKQKDRAKVDKIIDKLILEIKKEKVEMHDGILNYSVTRIMKGIYPRRYFHFNRAMGTLECIKQEFYRRWIGPYEDEKIKENGDVQ